MHINLEHPLIQGPPIRLIRREYGWLINNFEKSSKEQQTLKGVVV